MRAGAGCGAPFWAAGELMWWSRLLHMHAAHAYWNHRRTHACRGAEDAVTCNGYRYCIASRSRVTGFHANEKQGGTPGDREVWPGNCVVSCNARIRVCGDGAIHCEANKSRHHAVARNPTPRATTRMAHHALLCWSCRAHIIHTHPVSVSTARSTSPTRGSDGVRISAHDTRSGTLRSTERVQVCCRQTRDHRYTRLMLLECGGTGDTVLVSQQLRSLSVNVSHGVGPRVA